MSDLISRQAAIADAQGGKMNKQRKVVITTTYNEMGIIIDTKAEELGSSAQPEPCEDAVSRKAAIAQMQGLPKWNGIIADSCVDFDDVISVLENKENLPPVTPKQRTGKWIIRRWGGDAMCSECRMHFRDVYDMDNSDNFCRHCGTPMDGMMMEGDAE